MHISPPPPMIPSVPSELVEMELVHSGILKIYNVLDGTNYVLSRSQVSLNLGRVVDLAPFFNEKLQHEQYLTNVSRACSLTVVM